MSNHFKLYGFFIAFFLVSMIPVTYAAEGQTRPQINPASLQHLNTQLLNDYVATLMKQKEPEMKAAIDGTGKLSGFKLNDADFDIMTGKMILKFTVFYGKSDITGGLGFEIRMSEHGSPKIGGYCSGLEGTLRSKKFFADIILSLTKGMINKKLAGKEFWSDNQPHPEYKVFKNENLTHLVNQAFLENSAGNEQFKKITNRIPGGKAEVEFTNLKCDSFDCSTGIVKISSGLSGAITFAGQAFKLDQAGTMWANFDFYINPEDNCWWVKPSKFKLTVTILSPQLNDMLQETIDQELKTRDILMQLDMPIAIDN
jgi:hypothetical protein